MTLFKRYKDAIIIKDHVKSKHIIVGDYSYYAGYYHGKSFEDCVMYLDETDDQQEAGEVDQLIIGKFCSIATGATFMLRGTHSHNYDWISAYPLDFFDDDFDDYISVPPKGHKLKGDTIIGNDVWIGAESMILPGMHIADGAVIGARSLITKHVGPYEVWGGNPAHLIKKRFTDDEIQKLLQIKWWDFELEKLKENLPLIRSRNVNALWEKCQSELSEKCKGVEY